MTDFSEFITYEKIIHPRTEEEIEVIAIKTSPRPQLQEHQLTIYIDPKDGTILSRNYTNSDWCTWVPLPFNRQLHDRMKESSYKPAKSGYVQDPNKVEAVNFADLSSKEQQAMMRMLRRSR